MRRPTFAAVVIVLCAMFGSSVRAETVENPVFKLWSAFGVGTSVTMKGTNEAGPNKMDLETVSKLVDKKDDVLTIEISSTLMMGGQPQKNPPQKIEVKKTVDKADLGQPGKAAFDPDALSKAQEESVTVPAGTFKAKRMDIDRTQGAMKMKISSWISDEVPGGTVKTEVHGDGPMKINTVLELAAVDKK